MARMFDGTDQHLSYNDAVLEDQPITMACWFYAETDGRVDGLMGMGDADNNQNFLGLRVEGSTGGDPLCAIMRSVTGGYHNLASTGAVTFNAWQHGCLVRDSTSLYVYLNGGNSNSNVGEWTPGGALDRTHIGCNNWAGPQNYLDGSVADALIIKAALTAGEVWQLWRGVPPWQIRPGALVMYAPLRYGRTWDRDIERGLIFTANNGPTWAPHPPKAQKYWLEHDMRLFRRLAKAPAVAGETLSVAISGDNESYWRSGPLVVGSG